jgi:uncharacterized protein YdeI (YjbR/CyaY-like superfamily)
MNTSIEDYFTDGCGRCPLGGTPGCKVRTWSGELRALRNIVLSCGLTEEVKWGVPCYTFQKNNILIIGAFKENCTLSFFKGALLSDTENILQKPGEESQAGRVIRFTSVKQIATLETTLRAYIFEAVEVEKAGLKVKYKSTSEYAVPEEFQRRLDADKALKKAFEALTPGRQRGFLLHFSQAKQVKTREARIDKCIPMIMRGIGMGDNYR